MHNMMNHLEDIFVLYYQAFYVRKYGCGEVYVGHTFRSKKNEIKYARFYSRALRTLC